MNRHRFTAGSERDVTTTFSPGISGFSLIELLVAMVVFMVIAGAAFSLFAPQQTQFHQQ
ncbi:MAG: PilW family protein, partial [Terriglobia bacterium]